MYVALARAQQRSDGGVPLPQDTVLDIGPGVKRQPTTRPPPSSEPNRSAERLHESADSHTAAYSRWTLIFGMTSASFAALAATCFLHLHNPLLGGILVALAAYHGFCAYETKDE